MSHWWSDEEIDFLREHYKKHTIREMVPMFNERFNVGITFNQIKGTLRRYNITSGRDGKYKKNQPSWNKGKKGLNTGGEKGWFKVGNKPLNYKPVGTERVNKQGYVEVKVKDPRTWKGKHIVIWEQQNGPVPKGHVILFGDGDKTNLNIENLLLVSRQQLSWLNKHRLIKDEVELTKTGLIVADLYQKISDLNKEKNET